MRKGRAWATAGVLGALLVAGLALGIHATSSLSGPVPAPDFTLETVHHGDFTLSDHRGTIVVVDLMAVDCATCRVTEQSLLRLHERRDDVVIVSVNIWTGFEDAAYLDEHMQRIGADWPYGMDTDDVLVKYRAFEISKVAVVAKDGHIAGTARGAIGDATLARLVERAEGGEHETTFFPAVTQGGAGARSALLAVALFAGAASFFAPCAFPLLPGYMAYTLSLTRTRRAHDPRPPDTRQVTHGTSRHALAAGLAAASGILIVYAAFGAVVALLGETARPFVPLMQPAVGLLAVALGVALLLGATMQGVIAPLQRVVARVAAAVTRRKADGALTGYFSYGIGYGAAAAACTAPVFLALALTAFLTGWATGLQVFLVYAGTAAALMVLATLLAVKARGLLGRTSASVVQIMHRTSGAVLILAGVYLLWYYHRAFGLPLL